MKRNIAKRRRLMRMLLIIAVLLVGVKFADRIRAVDEARASLLEATPADSLLQVRTNPAQPEQLLSYDGFEVSFNPRAHIPNWVAWELTAEETEGTSKRQGQFRPDPRAEGCPETYDYKYSGYDRGHMCPAGDMKWSAEAMDQTFFLTNICPQAQQLNTGVWKRLEEKSRSRARSDSAIYIICGPVLTDTLREYIGDTRVAVPKRFFKVILSPYSDPPRAIGFIMNNGRVEGGMQAAATSVDEVERITGHDFFSALPVSLEQRLEQQNDFHIWNRAK